MILVVLFRDIKTITLLHTILSDNDEIIAAFSNNFAGAINKLCELQGTNPSEQIEITVSTPGNIDTLFNGCLCLIENKHFNNDEDEDEDTCYKCFDITFEPYELREENDFFNFNIIKPFLGLSEVDAAVE